MEQRKNGHSATKITELLIKPEFPRSSGYVQNWMLENQMGPNALWLAEYLSEAIPLKKGMRVLDLGCGKAITSIFLAKEFEVQVWACDLWITPDHNWQRAVEAGVENYLCPLRLEAHSLPFAAGFFDAIISVDAYHYFGTDELYLNYLCRFLRPGGYIGVVMPGLTRDFDTIPEHLSRPQSNGKVFWEDECRSFKSADWWRKLWNRNGALSEVKIDTLKDGWRHWKDFEEALEITGKNVFPSDSEALEEDRGRYIGFVRALGRKSPLNSENLYDPSLGARAGVDV